MLDVTYTAAKIDTLNRRPEGAGEIRVRYFGGGESCVHIGDHRLYVHPGNYHEIVVALVGGDPYTDSGPLGIMVVEGGFWLQGFYYRPDEGWTELLDSI